VPPPVPESPINGATSGRNGRRNSRGRCAKRRISVKSRWACFGFRRSQLGPIARRGRRWRWRWQLSSQWGPGGVSLMDRRDPQCHRYLATGHLRWWCLSEGALLPEVRRRRLPDRAERVCTVRSRGIFKPIVSLETPRSIGQCLSVRSPRRTPAPPPNSGEKMDGDRMEKRVSPGEAVSPQRASTPPVPKKRTNGSEMVVCPEGSQEVTSSPSGKFRTLALPPPLPIWRWRRRRQMQERERA